MENFFTELKKSSGEKPKSLNFYIGKIKEKKDLEPQEAYGAMRVLMSEGPSDKEKADFLLALNAKGESTAELAAFAFTLREMAKSVRLKEDIILGDICGTGGDKLNTFNISTTAMFILAASGMIIAKHGNRAITSKCGGADVLEALGVNINLTPPEVEKCLREVGISFLYAPNFHPAFKNIQPVRKSLGGVPTVFNMLGPLVNPAFDIEKKNTVQVLGVREASWIRKMAEVLKLLNTKRALVVHGYNKDQTMGMDEFSTLGENIISELTEDGRIRDFKVLPETLGLKVAATEDLTGGNAQENSQLLIRILQGKERGAKRDIVLLNAAAGLWVGEKVQDLSEGIKIAAHLIDSSQAYKKLEQLKKFRP